MNFDMRSRLVLLGMLGFGSEGPYDEDSFVQFTSDTTVLGPMSKPLTIQCLTLCSCSIDYQGSTPTKIDQRQLFHYTSVLSYTFSLAATGQTVQLGVSQTHVLLFGLELLGCHPITIRSLDLTIRAPTMCDTAPDVVAPAAAAALAAREKWELKPTVPWFLQGVGDLARGPGLHDGWLRYSKKIQAWIT